MFAMFHWIYRIVLLLSLLLSAQIMAVQTTISSAVKMKVPVLTIKGAIGPAVGDYISQEIILANNNPRLEAIILTIDTPGGLSSSLRLINQQILNSKILNPKILNLKILNLKIQNPKILNSKIINTSIQNPKLEIQIFLI